MEIAAPETVKHLLGKFVDAFQDFLGAKLVGVYLHGSLAMGCFNPVSSDVDILVVVRDKLSMSEKNDIGQTLFQLSELAPAKGVEMSIITLECLQNFQHPCPFELHFSNDNKADFAQGRVDFSSEMFDPDLAAHVVITRARGLRLWGERIDNVFPNISNEFYLDSIVRDCDWSYANIMKGPDSGECRVPVYGVLNFCRVLAFTEGHLITSKLEGGQWGVKHLAQEYTAVLQEALKEYATSGTAQNVDSKLLKQFANYAKMAIHQATKRLHPPPCQ